jgi:hypothetical protein
MSLCAPSNRNVILSVAKPNLARQLEQAKQTPPPVDGAAASRRSREEGRRASVRDGGDDRRPHDLQADVLRLFARLIEVERWMHRREWFREAG